MEKIEAIREWCIERALMLQSKRIGLGGCDANEVIKCAHELEEYIIGIRCFPNDSGKLDE